MDHETLRKSVESLHDALVPMATEASKAVSAVLSLAVILRIIFQFITGR